MSLLIRHVEMQENDGKLSPDRVVGYTPTGKGTSRFIISKFSALSMIAHMFLSMSQHSIHSLSVP